MGEPLKRRVLQLNLDGEGVNLDKLRKMGLVELGAVNGVLLGSVFELALRSTYLLEKHLQERTPLPPDLHIQISPYPFAWWYLPFLSLVLVTLAGLSVRRYLAPNITSPFLLWQLIGGLAVLGLCAYAIIVICYNWYSTDTILSSTEYLAHVLTAEMGIILRVAPFVLGFNLLFAFALSSSKGHSCTSEPLSQR